MIWPVEANVYGGERRIVEEANIVVDDVAKTALVKENEKLYGFPINESIGVGGLRGFEENCVIVFCSNESGGSISRISNVVRDVVQDLPVAISCVAVSEDEITDLAGDGQPRYRRSSFSSGNHHLQLISSDRTSISRLVRQLVNRKQTTVTSITSPQSDLCCVLVNLSIPDCKPSSLLDLGVALRSMDGSNEGITNVTARTSCVPIVIHNHIVGLPSRLGISVSVDADCSSQTALSILRFACSSANKEVIAPRHVEIYKTLTEAVNESIILASPRRSPMSGKRSTTLLVGGETTTKVQLLETTAEDDAWATILSNVSDCSYDAHDLDISPVEDLSSKIVKQKTLRKTLPSPIVSTAKTPQQTARLSTRPVAGRHESRVSSRKENTHSRSQQQHQQSGGTATAQFTSMLRSHSRLQEYSMGQEKRLREMEDVAVEVKNENFEVAANSRKTQQLNTKLEYDLRRMKIDYSELQESHVEAQRQIQILKEEKQEAHMKAKQAKGRETARLRESVSRSVRAPLKLQREFERTTLGDLKLELIEVKEENTNLRRKLTTLKDSRDMRDDLEHHQRILECLHERVKRSENEVLALKQENIILREQRSSMEREVRQGNSARDRLMDVVAYSNQGSCLSVGTSLLQEAADELTHRISQIKSNHLCDDEEAVTATCGAIDTLHITLQTLRNNFVDSPSYNTLPAMRPAIDFEIDRLAALRDLLETAERINTTLKHMGSGS